MSDKMRPVPRTRAGRRLFTDEYPMDMWESDGVTPEDIIAIENEAIRSVADGSDRLADSA